MELSKDEVIILIHQNALEEMEQREQRLLRALRRMQEELDLLGNDIRGKKFALAAARERLLRRCI